MTPTLIQTEDGFRSLLAQYTIEENRLRSEINKVMRARRDTEDALALFLINQCECLFDVLELIKKWPFPSELTNFNTHVLLEKVRSLISCPAALERIRLNLGTHRGDLDITINLTGDLTGDTEAITYFSDLMACDDSYFDLYLITGKAEFEFYTMKEFFALVPYSRFYPDLHFDTVQDVVKFMYEQVKNEDEFA